MHSRGWVKRIWLTTGYLFLYLPIIVLIVFSFNSARLDLQWSGFSLRWYSALLQDQEIINGFFLSLEVAILSATASVLLGTMAAHVLNRYRQFKGRLLFRSLASAPLIMPDVIVGLSLLIMLVTLQKMLGFPERGVVTIWMGHTLVGMAYATVVVQSRLQEMGRTLEEAALDLGCPPRKIFFLVTLPTIIPTLAAAWLLAFTLSFDDVVLASFLSGPGSETLPIVIFSRARLGLDPRVNAIATLTILVVTAGIILASWWFAHKQRSLKRIDSFR